jgi:hypothetical protein
VRERSFDAPFTPEAVFSAAVAQQTVRALYVMSRTAHLGISAVLGFICFWCVVMGFMVYVGMAVSPRSSAIGGVVFFGALVLASAYGAFWNLARAFRPPPKEPRSPESPSREQPLHPVSGATPDERLSHLVNKQEM